MSHDHFVAQLGQLPAYPRGMGPGFQCSSTARDSAEDFVDALRRRRQAVFQNHIACLIQDAAMACSVSQIQTDGQLELPKNLVATHRRSANLLHRGSPFSRASSTSTIGSVWHPVEADLLIPSLVNRKRTHYRKQGMWS